MIKRLFELVGAYLMTVVAMARAEADVDLAAMKAMLVRQAIAAGLLVFAFIWLNIALLLFLIRTGSPILASLVLGVLAAVAGVVMVLRGKASLAPTHGAMLSRTRQVLREELFAMGVQPEPEQDRRAADHGDLTSPAPALTPEGAAARLRQIRVEIGELVTPTSRAYIPAGVPDTRRHFEPQSATMRMIMGAWRGGHTGAAKSALGGVLGLVALFNPKLRRAMAAFAIVRTLARGVRLGGA